MRLRVVPFNSLTIVGVPVDLDSIEDLIEANKAALSLIENTLDSDKFYFVQKDGSYILGKLVSKIGHLPNDFVYTIIPPENYAVIHKSESDYHYDLLLKSKYKYSDVNLTIKVCSMDKKEKTWSVESRLIPVVFNDHALQINQLPHLSKEESTRIKVEYLATFFDTTDTSVNRYLFQKYITYNCGYHWEFIKPDHGIMCLNKTKEIVAKKGEVLFFWDGATSIGKEIGRKYIYKMDANWLINNYNRFTADLYIFDPSLSWTAIISHEFYNKTGHYAATFNLSSE